MQQDMPRRGDWVMVGKRVGILYEMRQDGCVVHPVDAKGETLRETPGIGAVQEMLVPYGELRLAREAEIPEPRRYPGEAEELRRSAALFAAAPPPVPGD